VKARIEKISAIMSFRSHPMLQSPNVGRSHWRDADIHCADMVQGRYRACRVLCAVKAGLIAFTWIGADALQGVREML
jgi:hypothetical protein